MPVAAPATACRAAIRVVWPVPQPMSSIRSDSVRAAAANRCAVNPAARASYRSALRIQALLSAPFHRSHWAAFAVVVIAPLPGQRGGEVLAAAGTTEAVGDALVLEDRYAEFIASMPQTGSMSAPGSAGTSVLAPLIISISPDSSTTRPYAP